MPKEQGILELADAIAIGNKITEMADRVRRADMVVPGSVGKWGFVLDDVEFDVDITVRRK